MLIFTLPDGTRAGIKPSHDLKELTTSQLGLDCLAPADEADVVFHVSSKHALDRVRQRFALTEC